jgi:hypothetical protein
MVHIQESHDLLKNNENKELLKVVLESRFSAQTIEDIVRNKKFTLACMRDCFLKGEAPYASHVIYAQTHILDDFISEERALGMHAGFLWGDLALKTVVYTDLGISLGMEMGIERAKKQGREIEYRKLRFIPKVHLEEVHIEKIVIENQKKLLKELQENFSMDGLKL